MDRLETAGYIHRDLKQGDRGLYTITTNKYPISTGPDMGKLAAIPAHNDSKNEVKKGFLSVTDSGTVRDTVRDTDGGDVICTVKHSDTSPVARAESSFSSGTCNENHSVNCSPARSSMTPLFALTVTLWSGMDLSLSLHLYKKETLEKEKEKEKEPGTRFWQTRKVETGATWFSRI